MCVGYGACVEGWVGMGAEAGAGERLGGRLWTLVELCAVATGYVRSTYWGTGEGAVLLFGSRLQYMVAL